MLKVIHPFKACAFGVTRAESAVWFVRGFKNKGKQAPLKRQSKAEGGRDPYAVFKEALTALPDEVKAAALTSEGEEERAERRSRHSREAMRENNRVTGHLTRLIKLREQAIAALPEALREEACKPDLTLLPIQRRVFTETAPIADFKAKLLRRDPEG
uniref:Uncharacterized protein n=1 Tax=Calcidiscus leptoporus TaxID=127549 RepID=A0A7S0IML5_9EUKA|mmetsp:Transcript_13327/g.30629  ORF Transcript_13327/g.30629 Transcript_13327/m.30629 type:complete len:157 (+) Transcript_13327:87-557(+)|eukprot:CAMPEP_0119374356 /NCGR_PEP_ID=MMETSP1334-20130426/30547_1 /TAXON_ID=127549 /ORGANISM="Calcidiscus leptoporus, Strain RCC1130" /LENGTH=156 /DNA_ID=CAMNT_0007392401 /DNA_START=87 /DNA_END=557 /DNA_ORIENTATION=-